MPHSQYLLVFFFIALCGIPSSVNSQPATFVIFRHAETAEVGKDDPQLSKSGQERARRLANLFRTADISAIYSTATKRTQSTVGPIAKLKGMQIQHYDPFDFEFTDAILNDKQSGIILIAAHSNTAPLFVNYLIGEQKYEQLNEDEHDKIFIITLSSIGNGTVLQLSY